MQSRLNFLYQNRLGIYCFQRRIPKYYWEKNKKIPKLLRFSLGTREKSVAVKLARMFSVMFDLRAKQYFKTEESYHEAIKLFQEYLRARELNKTYEELQANFFDNLDDTTASETYLLEQAEKYHRAIQIEKGNNPYKIQGEELQNLISERLNELNLAKTVNSTIHSVNLKTAFEEFINQKKISWRSSGGMESDFRKTYFPVFYEVVGDIKTDELTKANIGEYIRVVLALPSNKSKHPQYRNLKVKDFLKIKVPDEYKLHPTTKGKYLAQIGMFLKWLKTNDYTSIDLNLPLTAIKIPKVRANEQKSQYTHDDLKKIFNSDDYVKGLHKKPSNFWVPLIGIYTGARLNEICQLSVKDIYIEKNTSRWVIDINEDPTEDDKKSLKKPFHARKVPIHKRLIELGLIDFLKYQKKNKSKRLFPELVYVSDSNKYGDHIQRWFNRTYTKNRCDIKTSNTSFHSLRHTFISHLVNDKNVDPNKIAEGLGQTPQGGVTQTTYTKRLPIKDYIKYFDLADFDDCFSIKLIRPWKFHTFMIDSSKTGVKRQVGEGENNLMRKLTKSRSSTSVKKSTPTKRTVKKTSTRKTKTA